MKFKRAIPNFCADKTVTLACGRKLGYLEIGSGWPVLFFPPVPMSRLFVPKGIASLCAELKFRLIIVERPGCGLSSPMKERSYKSFALDVSEFAEKLGIEKFSVVGHSGGAMHALATAAFLPQKVVKLTVVGAAVEPTKLRSQPTDFPDYMTSLSKYMQDSVKLCGKSPHWLTRFAFWTVSGVLTDPVRHTSDILSRPGESSAFGEDQKIIEEFRKHVQENMAEYFRQGLQTMIDDMRAFAAKPWEYDLEEIKQETTIFVGSLDSYSPPRHSEYLSTKIPNSKLNILQSEVRCD